jgi:hypothetical protein
MTDKAPCFLTLLPKHRLRISDSGTSRVLNTILIGGFFYSLIWVALLYLRHHEKENKPCQSK